KPADKKASKTVQKQAKKEVSTTETKAAPASANHTKKDGTPDKRFKENKKPAAAKTKKDGTPDMRYKENKDAKRKS
ncbi:MAG TPA: hypothetical protein PLH33_08705, partial [Chitinophagaceae bacterium]|nr:hypothetical protein [Chitinophagaceae bacterium]